MKQFIKVWSIIFIFSISFLFFGNDAKATSDSFSYPDKNLLPRSVYYTYYDNYVDFTIGDSSYTIELDRRLIYAMCDENGTLWLLGSDDMVTKYIYWVNYEIEGENMTPHYFEKGELCYTNDHLDFINIYLPKGTNTYFYLPTPNVLKSILNGSKYTPVPYQTSSNSSTTSKFSKVKTSGNKVKLLDSNGTAAKIVTFNKETGVMTYNKKNIKNVKAVFFTEKGNIVYLNKDKKAYYFNGKKSTLIKKNVTKVVTNSKKFATTLKLKNGKKFTLKK